MGSLKSLCKTSYRSSIETIALNCLVFEKIAFLYALWRQTDEQTDKHTNEQMNSIDALRRSRCRQRRLNKNRNRVYHRRRHAAKKTVDSVLQEYNTSIWELGHVGQAVSLTGYGGYYTSFKAVIGQFVELHAISIAYCVLSICTDCALILWA